MKQHYIYLDYAATTPMDKRVLKKILPYFTERFENPSSVHDRGKSIKKDIEKARSCIARFLHCKPEEIVFTGSGTEAENLAIKGIAFSSRKNGNHVVISSVEHNSVNSSAEFLTKQGFTITKVPVDRYCHIDLDALRKAITDRTVLVSVMLVNNEIGTIQPIYLISRIIKSINKDRKHRGKSPVYLHVDAEAGCFYLDCNVKKLGVDALTINGSKMYGGKGTAALFLRHRTPLATQISGGGQERFLRGGTENVPGIIALAKAASLARAERSKNVKKVLSLKELFIKEMKLHIPDAHLNTPPQSVPNIVHFTFPKTAPVNLVELLSKHGIAVSRGSACAANHIGTPHVLKAVGFSKPEIIRSLRFSFGKGNSKKEVRDTVKVLKKILHN